MSRQTYLIIMAMLGVVALGVLYAFYLVIFPLRVVEIKQPMEVKHDAYMPGDTVEYVLDYCKYVDSRSTSSKQLVNSVIYSYPERGVTLPKGCDVIVSKNTVIPDYVEAGTYHIELTVTYDINPLHKHTETFISESFRVVTE